MPTLTGAQSLPGFTQTASLTVRASLSAAQQMPAFVQAAGIATPPARMLSANQQMPAFVQEATLKRARFRGPATARPPRPQALPRPE